MRLKRLKKNNFSPSNLRPLMKHQKEASIKFKYKDYAILFMQQRTGKSIVVLRWIAEKKKKNNIKLVLILAPLSSIPDWFKEIKLEQIPSDQVFHISTKHKKKCFEILNDLDLGSQKKTLYFFSNLETMRINPIFLSASWDVIVVDESVRIKNAKSQITKILLTGTKHIRFKAILSGLPAPEKPLEFFTQMSFVLPHNMWLGFDDYWKFRNSMFHQHPYMEYGILPNLGTIEKIKKSIHSIGFICSRKDCDLGSSKIYKRYSMILPKSIFSNYKLMEKNWYWTDDPEEEFQTKYAITTILWLSIIAGGFHPDKKQLLNDFKYKHLIDIYNNTYKRNKEKIIIWFRFNHEIKKALEFFQKNNDGNHVKFINGSVSIENRKNIVNEFNDVNSNLNVLLLQIKCCKHGVDLSASDTAIYFSTSYSLEEREQSEDRIIHKNKKKSVLYLDITSEGTIDEDILSALQSKSFQSKTILSGLLNIFENKKKNKKIGGN